MNHGIHADKNEMFVFYFYKTLLVLVLEEPIL